ncbi:MAG TPA: MarR family winged helix-turn-helix transcriptional regulator [Solirubrobacterales bacterium]|nr:MarR family winged helix-turn-helix transcriptional regulator [Solirubrobacterales bacterium]
MTAPPNTPLNRTPLPLPGLLAIASEAMFAEFREDLVKAGYGDIRPTHGCVFRFVREDGMRLTELATLAGITKQSAGELVDDLAARGYIERFPDPADRRAKLLRLTARGEEAQAIGSELFGKLEERWAERYGNDRLEQLRHLLEEIAATEAPTSVPELAAAEPAPMR